MAMKHLSSIGRWYEAKQKDGKGFMVVEITGEPSDGSLPATIILSNLTEIEAKAQCLSHNGLLDLEVQ